MKSKDVLEIGNNNPDDEVGYKAYVNISSTGGWVTVHPKEGEDINDLCVMSERELLERIEWQDVLDVVEELDVVIEDIEED